jgi:predicted acylesterase/phospholipase RssA
MIGHIGVLSKLMEADVLDQVRDWYGCSGGAICALFGVIGVTSAWLREAVEHFDPRVVAAVEEETVADFMNVWGVNSGATFIEILSSFIDTWEPGCSKWTFADLVTKRPGKTLNVTATNVTRGAVTVFNATTTPNMNIVLAVRVSSSIPLFYTPWFDASGDLYCDGAAFEYHPWSCVKDKDHTLVIACSDVGITGRRIHPESIKSIGDYLGRLSFVSRLQRATQTPRNWIAVNNKVFGTFDFSMTKEERQSLFQEGRVAAAGWLAFQQSRVRQRDASEERPGNSRDRGLPDTSSSCPGGPDRRLDNPQCHNPPLPTVPPHSPRDEAPRACRRWSL